jgi:hypothetical protein
MGDVLARRAQRVVHAQQVDLDRPFEHLGVAAHQRQLRGHARVGHHDVESVQVLDRRLDRRVHLLAVAHVAHHRERVAAFRGGARQQVGLDPGQHDPRPACM